MSKELSACSTCPQGCNLLYD
uniref:Uncharacterized protein n=1 Tax=Rhizophora mucronata TaxID=61149 RepID=A0A2P2PLM9_RHIMU